MPPPRQDHRPAPQSLAAAAGRLAALTIGAIACVRTTVDPDLWGHLRFGLDALASRHLPSAATYSFTADATWINHEWLSEILQALAFRAGGTAGLLALKTGVLAATFVLIEAAVRRADPRYRWWFLATGFAAMAPGTFTNRPQIWTLLALAIVWRALGDPRRRAWIPLVFALWANLHGGWIVGAGVCGLWLAGRLIEARDPKIALPDAIAIVAGVAATLLNPYGWRLWARLASTVGLSRDITEWRPLWQQGGASYAVLWGLIVFGIVVLTILRRRSTLTWSGALPVLGLGAGSLFVARLLPLFGEVAVLGFTGAWRPDSATEADRPAPASRPLGFAVIDAAIIAIVAAPYIVGQAHCLGVAGSWAPDLRAAGALASPSVSGRLVLPFDWGEYAIWHFAPRLRVSIDGRRETVYSATVLNTQAAVESGRPEGLRYLDRERPEYVWLRSSSQSTRQWLASHGYRVDVATDKSFVARRADLPPLREGPALSGCFP